MDGSPTDFQKRENHKDFSCPLQEFHNFMDHDQIHFLENGSRTGLVGSKMEPVLSTRHVHRESLVGCLNSSDFRIECIFHGRAQFSFSC